MRFVRRKQILYPSDVCSFRRKVLNKEYFSRNLSKSFSDLSEWSAEIVANSSAALTRAHLYDESEK